MSTGRSQTDPFFGELVIIDLSTVLAGPSVATFFAELGARVIKIEHPKHKDVTRSWKLPSEDPASEVSAYFSSINYRKEYRFLDLMLSSDRAILNDLLDSADLLISNFKNSDYDRFNLGREVLRSQFPRLIHGRISGYGANSDRVAYDLILQAESGFMSMNGTADSGPVKMPVALIDVLAAHQLKEGLLCALLQRERNGKGGHVDVSLLEAAISSLVNQASNYLMAHHVPKRIGSLHPNIAPYGELFNTLDAKQITFAIGSDAHFTKLLSVLGLDDLSGDERFSNNQVRVINRMELALILSEAVSNFLCHDLLNKLHSLNVPAGEIKALDGVFLDPVAQKMIREEEIDGILTKRVSALAFTYDGN